jgi:hypothetical protein
MTVRDWISGSLRLIGVLAAGDALEATMGANCLQVASDMLDAWALERLLLYTRTSNDFALGAQQRYTLGTGGNWNQTRPADFHDVSAAYVTADGLEVPIAIYSDDEWSAISDRDTATGSLPFGIYINPAYPLAQVDVYPTPTDSTVQIRLYSRIAPLKSVSSLNTALSLPEGWAEALKYNLALRLAVEYPPQGGIDPAVVAFAADSKAAIKRPNEPNDEMMPDRALLWMSGGGRWSSSARNFDDF